MHGIVDNILLPLQLTAGVGLIHSNHAKVVKNVHDNEGPKNMFGRCLGEKPLVLSVYSLRSFSPAE